MEARQMTTYTVRWKASPTKASSSSSKHYDEQSAQYEINWRLKAGNWVRLTTKTETVEIDRWA